MTQKGQITLPKEVRDVLGIELYGKVRITIDKKNNGILLQPVKDIVDMAGFLTNKVKSNKNKSPLEARDFMENNYTRI